MLQKYLIADLPKADALLPFLRRIDETRWHTNFGPLATEFEHKMRDLLAAVDPYPDFGAIRLTTISTCHHALAVGLRMLHVPQGGKVLVPAVTFPSCPLAVQEAGGEAILGDVDPDTWTLTPQTARSIAEKNKLSAVMPVAIYGVPLPIEAWDEFQRDTGIPVIIDAAAAIERQIIPQLALVAHSLHATKPFGAGEGGFLVSRSQDIIDRVRIYSNFGTLDRISVFDGSNTKMSEYHAAVGVAQFERWQAIKQKRHEQLSLYKKHLEPLASSLSLQPGLDQAVTSALMLRLNKPVAAEVIAAGPTVAIAFHKMYLPPLYRHPYFANLSVANQKGYVIARNAPLETKAAHMPHSETMFVHIVGVPFHPFLEEEDIGYVTTSLQRLLAA